MKPLRVLVACEFSGIVRDAFAAKGHDAWSCDLLSSERPGNHFQCDFRDVLDRDWDFVGFHLDCRVMANSGARWLYEKPGRWTELKEAAELFRLALSDPRPGYVENSVMHCHAKKMVGAEQNQTIQPWQFGEPYFKATCLWLRAIPTLVPTNVLDRPAKGTTEHKAWSMVHRAARKPDRWKTRSRTFPGIATAMAEQWSTLTTPDHG